MKCLAVNTATQITSIAITDGGNVLYRFETQEMRDQGNTLLSRIQDGLAQSKLDFAGLDLLAVVTGPGSFTGIRIGLATMRGIALAADKPLIGLSSFDMFAAPQADTVNIIAVESWREELYFAVQDEEGHAVIECMNTTPAVFSHRFQHTLPGQENIVLSGDAKRTLAPLFPQALLTEADADATDVARVAISRFKNGHVPARPVPYYLREADVTISAKISKTLEANEA